MRCPECHHRARTTRWWHLPETLSCYGCGAKLQRASRLSFSEAIATWMLVMLPAAAIALFGGMSGFVLGGVLALAIFPARPWRGLRYRLADGQPSGLPVARLLGRRPGPALPAAADITDTVTTDPGE